MWFLWGHGPVVSLVLPCGHYWLCISFWYYQFYVNPVAYSARIWWIQGRVLTKICANEDMCSMGKIELADTRGKV